jgi:hypothetical protein
VQDICVNKENNIDLLKFRKKILYFMRRASRYPAYLINNDIEYDSDISIINIIAIMIYYCIEANITLKK